MCFVYENKKRTPRGFRSLRQTVVLNRYDSGFRRKPKDSGVNPADTRQGGRENYEIERRLHDAGSRAEDV
jgi:hypothetical protein